MKRASTLHVQPKATFASKLAITSGHTADGLNRGTSASNATGHEQGQTRIRPKTRVLMHVIDAHRVYIDNFTMGLWGPTLGRNNRVLSRLVTPKLVIVHPQIAHPQIARHTRNASLGHCVAVPVISGKPFRAPLVGITHRSRLVELVDIFEGKTLGFGNKKVGEDSASHTSRSPEEKYLHAQTSSLDFRSGLVDEIWSRVADTKIP